MKIISIDTETTGLDFAHGAKPFFVTTSDVEGNKQFWQWPVDPLTREPAVDPDDVEAIRQALDEADVVVGQNIKFDAVMLSTIGIDIPWKKVHDTLVAGHLLASNQAKDLTALALFYLGVDIEPYEKALGEVVAHCRRQVQQARLKAKRGKDANELAAWRIAEKGLEDMPSAKDETWKFDTWLPAAMLKAGFLKDRPDANDALLTYANADSEATAKLWPIMESLIRKRKQWNVYLDSIQLPPILMKMQQRGLTFSVSRCEELNQEYLVRLEKASQTCLEIAAEFGYDLKLPKGSSNNNSVLHFCFGNDNGRWLDLPVLERTEGGSPSIKAEVIDKYLLTLEGEQLRFIEAFAERRVVGKEVGDLASYRRYAVKVDDEYCTLHPNTNQTGTGTTRFSSDNPNGQNVKKRKDKKTGRNARYCFGPAPGRELWSADYENLELRIPAYEAEEADLIELFERPNDPPFYGSEHLLNFSVVYEDVWKAAIENFGVEGAAEEIRKTDEYKWCKNGDFALQYNCGQATADRAFRRPGYSRLKARFAKKSALNKRMLDHAAKHGYVLTMCGYPLICTRTEYGGILPTVPLSYHVQGTAGGCARRAMVRCQKQLDEWNQDDPRGYYMLLQIHDELLFDFPAGGRRNLPKIMRLKALMEESGKDIGIPLKVSIGYHPNNWLESVKIQ